MCLSLCHSTLSSIFVALWYDLKSGGVSPPNFLFSCKIFLAILGLCILNVAFCFLQKKKSYRNFDKDFIKSVDQFGEKLRWFVEKTFRSMNMARVLIYLKLSCWSNVLWYAVYKSCTSCVNFLAMCIILFDTILGKIFFLIAHCYSIEFNWI